MKLLSTCVDKLEAMADCRGEVSGRNVLSP